MSHPVLNSCRFVSTVVNNLTMTRTVTSLLDKSSHGMCTLGMWWFNIRTVSRRINNGEHAHGFFAGSTRGDQHVDDVVFCQGKAIMSVCPYPCKGDKWCPFDLSKPYIGQPSRKSRHDYAYFFQTVQETKWQQSEYVYMSLSISGR